MNKSRVATIEHLVKHPIYKKYIRRTSKLMFHDEKNETRMGDKVLVKQSKPLSARKRFTLLEVVEKAKVHHDPKLLGEG
jgi:small subunit ribosomal protein S17